MKEVAGNYICIGVVSYGKDFRNKVINLVNFLDELWCDRIDYLKSFNCLDEIKEQKKYNSIEDMIDCCIGNNMVWARGEFNLEEYKIKNVLFHVETLSDDRKCFMIEMPEQHNLIFQDIDRAENAIIHFFEEISQFHFLWGFCDNEAGPEDGNGYAIYVEFEPEFNIMFQPWKIDGFTDRNSLNGG